MLVQPRGGPAAEPHLDSAGHSAGPPCRSTHKPSRACSLQFRRDRRIWARQPAVAAAGCGSAVGSAVGGPRSGATHWARLVWQSVPGNLAGDTSGREGGTSKLESTAHLLPLAVSATPAALGCRIVSLRGTCRLGRIKILSAETRPPSTCLATCLCAGAAEQRQQQGAAKRAGTARGRHAAAAGGARYRLKCGPIINASAPGYGLAVVTADRHPWPGC